MVSVCTLHWVTSKGKDQLGSTMTPPPADVSKDGNRLPRDPDALPSFDSTLNCPSVITSIGQGLKFNSHDLEEAAPRVISVHMEHDTRYEDRFPSTRVTSDRFHLASKSGEQFTVQVDDKASQQPLQSMKIDLDKANADMPRRPSLSKSRVGRSMMSITHRIELGLPIAEEDDTDSLQLLISYHRPRRTLVRGSTY